MNSTAWKVQAISLSDLHTVMNATLAGLHEKVRQPGRRPGRRQQRSWSQHGLRCTHPGTSPGPRQHAARLSQPASRPPHRSLQVPDSLKQPTVGGVLGWAAATLLVLALMEQIKFQINRRKGASPLPGRGGGGGGVHALVHITL
jgi:hypothetical protein